MLDVSDVTGYFRELWKLSKDAAQFQWNMDAASDCAKLAEELKCMLERCEIKDPQTVTLEFFFREMLAECDPNNAAYYVSPVCSEDSSIFKHAWFAYGALRTMELDYKPKGVTRATLTVCASMGVACKKTIKMLEDKSANKDLSTSPFFSTHPGQILLAKMHPKMRRSQMRVVAGTDCRN